MNEEEYSSDFIFKNLKLIYRTSVKIIIKISLKREFHCVLGALWSIGNII